MPTTPAAGSIVIAHDSSPHSAAALSWGLEQASVEDRPVDVVHLLSVTEAQQAAWLGASGAGLQALDDLRDQAVAHLEGLAVLARAQYPSLRIRTHVVEREARHGLIDLSASAHLMVLGSHGRGPLTSPLLGSVSAAVTRRAECPVVVVRPPRPASDTAAPTGSGVLVGVDGTAESVPVLEFAFAQAALRGHHLTAVHCVRDLIAAYVGDAGFPTEEEMLRARAVLAESVAGLAEKYPDVAVSRRLNRGLLDQLVTDADKAWDLVVVGGRRHGALHRLLVGSTTIAVLERAHCPVAVVPEGRTPTG